ncbi:origin recognition complex subunit 4 [Conoideocrella luteorostrata]|uniref:Origin recognition complex subunit 4 n=1 Tax=Conoideocrella luteorostrata TaxID=1105319 RepID=A0AAJ0CE00_9HYPO|nr:origin recognition complex subunit 4 [Conoideocrella luteorostrata]
MDQNAAAPTSRKRSLDESGNDTETENENVPLNQRQTPTSIKRQKLEEKSAGSPSTPKALTAIASAISGVFGYGRQSQTQVNGNAPATSTAPKMPVSSSANGVSNRPLGNGVSPVKPRPAIKLAALKGTIWDNGNLPTTKKSSAPSRPARKPMSSPAPRPNHVAASPQKPSVAGAVPSPKSILTPTKKKRGRPRKNVTFNRGLDGEVFFEDLPKTPSAKKPRMTKAQKAQEEYDGIACEICSKPDSKSPNEIILCDNCDFAVHQQCYDISEIPEGEWLCKSCSQEDVLKTPNKSADSGPKVAEPAQPAEVPDIPNLDHHLRAFQRVLLDRCSGRRRIRIFGQEEAYEKARQLVEQTVLAGEGNSMLVIGPRGCGKTTLVETIIVDLSKEHRHEFHVVRLNGFIHTDDKIALKEIWRQLGKEMEVEDDLLNRTNYADTMASLLALLSHPSEIMGTDEGITSQSVVFIIDEFDMFAAHPRQTLLYNLFDIAQSRKAPIAVLGCTTRLDVVEMLEKRVKSRFSHRYVYLAPPKSLPGYWQICRQGLMIDQPDAETEGIDVKELYKQRQFQHLLQYHYFTTKSSAAFFTEWILPLSSISAKDVTLTTPVAASELTSLAPPDSRLQLLSALSDLDLGMLIAAARLDIVAHTDTVNFAMAYDEYSSLVAKQRVQSSTAGMLAMGGMARVWSRGVAGIAWERLITLGLLVPAGIGGGSRSMGHGGLAGKMWKVDVALEEIPTAVKLGVVLARWCREI